MRYLCLLGLLATCTAQTLGGEKDLRSAEQIMTDAHVVRSNWDKSFPGFTAKISANLDGQVTTGTITVTPEGKVELDVPKNDTTAWAREQLRSIVMHRFGGVRKYDVSFADDVQNHPLGRLIKFNDSSTHSVYRIKGDLITEVHRDMGGRKFTISVSDVLRNKEGKYLPSHFNVSYWDSKSGQLVQNEDYQEEWLRLGQYDLPKRRLMIETSAGARRVGELVLSEHSLQK